MPDLAIVIPTRGRPNNVRKVIEAWDFTNAWDHANLILVADADDPEIGGYQLIQRELEHPDTGESLATLKVMPDWLPMVDKLDYAVLEVARSYFAVGFAGDDHLPRTIGWAARYLTVLRELGSGMVYGDDGYQGRNLSTEWAVTSDVVLALGRMVPADVEHMYCDNAMMDLFGGAGALRHLPEVRIEHMHPVAGKATSDEQYRRVNHRDQFSKDRREYERWKRETMAADVASVRRLRKGRPDVTNDRTPEERARRVAGSAPRPVSTRRGREVQRSGPTSARGNRPPRHFKNVRGATPEDVMVALADLAAQVPADREIVELGVFQGRTALQLAWGASQGHGAHVTAIDPWNLEGNVYDPPFTDPGSKVLAQTNVGDLGYRDRITLIQGFSASVAESWTDDAGEYPKPVGLLYVDGDHTHEGARRDIESWARHLAPGAVIAVDDYGHPDWPGVQTAVDELVAEGFLKPIELYHDRLAVTGLTDVIERTDPVPVLKPTVTAITSEGVSPSPYPAVTGQVADQLPPTARYGEAVPESAVTVELPGEKLDASTSTDDWAWKVTPEEAVALTVPAGPVADLNTVQLRALAKHRGIVLGVRKDKRDDMLQALRDGR